MAPHKGSRKSIVWNYFTRISEEYVRCNVCQTTELKMMPNSSTTNMLTHLRKKHQVDPLKDKMQMEFFEQQMSLEQMEQENREMAEPINPLTWLNFENITDRSARCLMCGQDVELVPDVSQPRIIRHLARKHPMKYRELFGFEPENEQTGTQSVNDQLVGNIEDAIMRELHQPSRSIFVKSEHIEPQEVEVEILPPDQPSTSRGNSHQEHFAVPALPLKPNHTAPPQFTASPVPSFAPQNQDYFHQYRKRSVERSSPAPSPATASRASSPPPEKKPKFFLSDNNDEYRALGSLVEMELRSVGLQDPILAMKYQISIQEELTKMKKEMLLKKQTL